MKKLVPWKGRRLKWDEGLTDSMKELEILLQNGEFDEYFLIKLEEAHQENIKKEREKKLEKKKNNWNILNIL